MERECVCYLNETFNLALPNLDIGGKKHIAYLGYNPSPSTGNWTWTYKSHFPVVSRAGGGEDGSSSYGTLAPFTEPTPVDGSGKTLLLWYMVGSDLESNGGAGTTDFNEMLKAYQNLGGTPQLDVLIAFGGAAKEGWQGVKFATAQQVINDGADGVYGNSNDYLYTESRAHMGDQSTFTAFLKYAQQGYQNYDRRVLMMWDHGGSFRGFGNDNNFGMNGLQLNEIANSLQNSGIGKLDMIGFDACLMASAEVAKTIAPYGHYLLASEELEPGHGWNWTHVITQFASNTDLVAIGKSVADNFVDSQSHPSKQDGKTLSLLDLSQAGSVKAKLDTFARNLTQRLQSGDSQAREAFIHASKEVRFYADKDRNKAKDAGYGHDLGHFLELFVARTPDASATELLQAVKNFVLHSVHDGTRPNSNGVFLHSFDAKPPSKDEILTSPDFNGLEAWKLTSVSEEVWELKNTWQKYLAGDLTPPQVTSQAVVSSSTVLSLEQKLHEAYLKNNPTYASLNPEQQKQALAQEKPYYEGLEGTELDTKIAEYSPLPLDFVPAPTTRRTSYSEPSILNGERAAFIKRDVRRANAANGILANFADANLSSVKTLFGNILDVQVKQEDGSLKNIKTFSIVSELTAEPTTKKGEYFTPEWNQNWYTMRFDAVQETAWLPLLHKGSFEQNGKRYIRYQAEVDYVDGALNYQRGKHFEDENGQLVDYAVMDVTVDESNHVVNYKLTPYKIIYDGPNDLNGSVLFSKATHTLKTGDKIRFYALQLDMTADNVFDNNAPSVWAPTTPALMTLTQTPVFGVEQLQFEDGKGLLPYFYTLKAEDAAGNSTFTTPQPTAANNAVSTR